MENSAIEAALDDAIEAVRENQGSPEEGLTVDDPALLQLRKAADSSKRKLELPQQTPNWKRWGSIQRQTRPGTENHRMS